MDAWNRNLRKNVIMKFKNKYFLLRHGQTIYQKENRKMNYKASENLFITLTKEGKEMIKGAAKALKNSSIDMIFASPYERTKETAEIVSAMLKIKKINYDKRLVDINLGKFMGKSMEESWRFYLKGKNKFDNIPEDGESWADVLKRVKSFLDDTEKEFHGKNILVVSHADPIWLMAGVLRSLKTEEQFIKARDDRENSYPKLGQLIII